MSIQLSKRVEQARIVLSKQGLKHKIVARVGFVADRSGSMHTLYANGTVTNLMQQMMGVAINFDDNGEMEVWVFNEDVTQLANGTASNYDTYGSYLLSANGGTSFAPAIESIIDEYFPKQPVPSEAKTEVEEVPWYKRMFGIKPTVLNVVGADTAPVPNPASDIPAIVFFQTDGDNQDQYATKRLLQQYAHLPIFWQFVGVGDNKFDFLKNMEEEFNNVGFIEMREMKVDDDVLYSMILDTKLISWIKTKNV